MVQIDIQRQLAAVQLEVAVEIDVQNYGAIIRNRRGRLVASLSGLPSVRRQVDTRLRDQITRAIEDGLDERLRVELLTNLERHLSDTLSRTLGGKLAENDVVADVRVTVDAR